MSKKIGQIGAVLFVLIILSMFAVTSCEKKEVGLKGANIAIGSWWDNYDVETYQPDTEEGELQLERRRKLLEEHGFNMRHVAVADWGDYVPTVTNNIIIGDKSVHMYSLIGEWVMMLYKQDLLYPLNESSVSLKARESIAFEQTGYNEMVEQLYTFNGNQYVLSVETGLGDCEFVVWNKRLFREAGLDPDLPYDLQKEGNWTWDEFLRLAKILTKDTNNDGIIDIYGLPCDDPRAILDSLIYSNNANWVTIDSSGRFHNATNTPEFFEALQFYVRLNEEGVMKPRPQNAAWDWDYTEFNDAKLAMWFAPNWRVSQISASMVDDYGVVLPPKGPRMDRHRLNIRRGQMAIPNIFTREEVDVILRAYDLWMIPVSTDWKQGHYRTFRDRRAVDETLAMIMDKVAIHTNQNYTMVPGFNTGSLIWNMFEHQGSPAQLIESFTPVINSWLDNINN